MRQGLGWRSSLRRSRHGHRHLRGSLGSRANRSDTVIPGGDHGARTEHFAQQRHITRTRFADNTLAGAGVDGNAFEVIFHFLSLLQVARLIELNAPYLAGLTVDGEGRAAGTDDFVAQATAYVVAIFKVADAGCCRPCDWLPAQADR